MKKKDTETKAGGRVGGKRPRRVLRLEARVNKEEYANAAEVQAHSVIRSSIAREDLEQLREAS